MLQIIEEPTREENTLDLIFTNEISLATMIEVNKTKLFDHINIEVSTNYIIVINLYHAVMVDFSRQLHSIPLSLTTLELSFSS